VFPIKNIENKNKIKLDLYIAIIAIIEPISPIIPLNKKAFFLPYFDIIIAAKYIITNVPITVTVIGKLANFGDGAKFLPTKIEVNVRREITVPINP
jgi:hypothetical protein